MQVLPALQVLEALFKTRKDAEISASFIALQITPPKLPF